MAIYRLLQNGAFNPEDIKRMTTAYEKALVVLGLNHRSGPVTENVAKHIILVTQTGEKDPDTICDIALKLISQEPPRPRTT